MWSDDSWAEARDPRTESRGHCEINILGLETRRKRQRKIREATETYSAED